MFHNEFITLFFQILNIMVLVAISGYLFYTRVLVIIYQKIQQKEDEHKDLEHRYNIICEEQNTLQTARDHQKQAIGRLQEKIVQWNIVVQEEHSKTLRVERARHNALIEKQKKQALVREINQTNQIVLPEAVAAAHAKLCTIFESDAKGQAYIDHIITYLQKNSI